MNAKCNPINNPINHTSFFAFHSNNLEILGFDAYIIIFEIEDELKHKHCAAFPRSTYYGCRGMPSLNAN
jgi:hypothetical protein